MRGIDQCQTCGETTAYPKYVMSKNPTEKHITVHAVMCDECYQKHEVEVTFE